MLGVGLLSAALAEQGAPHAVVDANLDFLRFIESGRWGHSGSFAPFLPAHAHNASQYLTGYRQQQQMLRLLGKAFPRYGFAPYQVTYHGEWPDLRRVAATALEPDSIWRQWVAAGAVVQDILRHQPDWVGLSVNFDGQLPAALALGQRLREEGVTVIWGGGLLNAFAQQLTEQTPIWHSADGVMLGAGESLVTSLEKVRGRVSLPGARVLSNGCWIASGVAQEQARRPNFDAFPLGDYRAAGRVLPYRVFSRCQWRKCVFCADARYHFHADRLDGNPELVAEDLHALAVTYGADGVYFLDAELPAAFMVGLAGALQSRQANLRWGGNSRISRRLADPTVASQLYSGGCRFLRFGLESASDAVLRGMCKGTTAEMAGRVLRSVAEAGMGVHVYLMHGFPGEQVADVRQTVDFLFENLRNIDGFNFSEFALYEESPIARAADPDDIARTAAPDFWSHPEYRQRGEGGVDDKDIEERFYTRKKQIKCFPTMADSILLSERYSLSFAD